MKKYLLSGIFALFMIGASAQTAEGVQEEQTSDRLASRLALKELVDRFSTLSDVKDAKTQALLFTKDALVQTYIDGKLMLTLNGREEIEKTFGNFLNTQETVYHINGQQTVEFVDDNTAKGISYCQVTMIVLADGVRTMSMQGVSYNDEYKRIDGRWFISKRESHFVWRDTKVIK